MLREELKDIKPEAPGQQATGCDAYDQRLRELEEIGGEVEEQMD